MSQELELKFKVDDFQGVEAKLLELGAVLGWKGEEENWFFDTADKKLKEMNKSLRLKKQGEHGNTFTVKVKSSEDVRYKSRDEYEIKIDDIPMSAEILKLLGFEETLNYKKHREHWRLGDSSIELDELNGIKIVEIEGGEEKINELAGILNLDFKTSTTKSYSQILREGL